jgi:hypothetical protein
VLVFDRRTVRAAVCACAVLTIGTADAGADLREATAAGTLTADTATIAAAMPAAEPIVHGTRRVRELARETADRRPAGLVPLYVTFAALQALDAHSTLIGVRGGHAEANPFMAPVAREPALLIGAKSTVAVGTIVVSERLWRRHRTAAIVLMVAVNAAHAAVVAHNYRKLRR